MRVQSSNPNGLSRVRTLLSSVSVCLAGDLAPLQHAYIALVALLLALLPVENAEGAELEADEELLGAN